MRTRGCCKTWRCRIRRQRMQLLRHHQGCRAGAVEAMPGLASCLLSHSRLPWFANVFGPRGFCCSSRYCLSYSPCDFRACMWSVLSWWSVQTITSALKKVCNTFPVPVHEHNMEENKKSHTVCLSSYITRLEAMRVTPSECNVFAPVAPGL